LTAFYRFVLGIAKIIVSLRGVKFTGRENLLDNGAVVVIGNHTHWSDPVYVAVAYKKRQISFMGKVELFKNKIVALLLKKLTVISVDRNANDIKALKSSLAVLKNQQVLGIFPEGTRASSADEELLEFKNGSVMLALKSKAPIIPIGIVNAENLLRFGKEKPQVHIGEPIWPTMEGFADKQAAMDHWSCCCRDAVAGLRHKQEL